jgi:hypothetical protein
MALLNAEQFLKIDDHAYEVVDLPKLGGSVKIRSLSGSDALTFEKMRKESDGKELIFWLILKCCVNEDNSLMFNESHLTEIEDKSPDSILTLFNAILDLNRTSDKDIKEEAKNS